MVAGGDDRDSKLACFFKKTFASLLAALPLTQILFILYFSAWLFLCMIWAFVFLVCRVFPWVFCLVWAVARFLILPTRSLSPHASRGLKCAVSRRLRWFGSSPRSYSRPLAMKLSRNVHRASTLSFNEAGGWPQCQWTVICQIWCNWSRLLILSGHLV